MTEATQFALPFAPVHRYEDEDFVPDESNEAACEWLGRGDWPDRRLALWGPEGSGKTHLLHIWARRTGAMLIEGPGFRDLSRLPESGGIALDDASGVSDETLLLHTLNIARDRDLLVLIADRLPPARWEVRLPDLVSRIRAISTVPILPPSDSLLSALLAHEFASRQLKVAPELQAMILKRLPRSAAAVLEVSGLLDHESLTMNRSITRDLVARVLARHDNVQGG